MSLSTPTAVSVTTAATALVDANPGSAALPQPVLLYNESSTITAYIGGSDVTAATGMPLAPLAQMSFTLAGGDDLHAITSSSTAAVRVMKRA